MDPRPASDTAADHQARNWGRGHDATGSESLVLGEKNAVVLGNVKSDPNWLKSLYLIAGCIRSPSSSPVLLAASLSAYPPTLGVLLKTDFSGRATIQLPYLVLKWLGRGAGCRQQADAAGWPLPVSRSTWMFFSNLNSEQAKAASSSSSLAVS